MIVKTVEKSVPFSGDAEGVRIYQTAASRLSFEAKGPGTARRPR